MLGDREWMYWSWNSNQVECHVGRGVVMAGFVADVDFESERYRWMGRFRLDIQVYTFGLSLLVMSNINVDNGY
jgi:hypothetical protein